MSFSLKDVVNTLESMDKILEENKQYLTDLDAAIGDGDHGLNMNKGFRVAIEKLKAAEIKDIGSALKIISMALISNVGGASGPLYGTAFMKAAPLGNGKVEMDLKDLRDMFKAAIEGIKARGKGEVGDKTMLDVLEPAYNRLVEGIEKEESPVVVLEGMEKAAKAGVEFTKTIAARKGRASYLGERSIGHQDPGATSSYFIIKTMYEEVKKITKE